MARCVDILLVLYTSLELPDGLTARPVKLRPARQRTDHTNEAKQYSYISKDESPYASCL